MVMGREEDIALEAYKVIVECLNRLKVEMVCRGVENKAVGILELHTRNHTTHFLASREHVYFLLYFFLLEEHTSKESLHCHFVAGAIL